jgi:hypothetical protein
VIDIIPPESIKRRGYSVNVKKILTAILAILLIVSCTSINKETHRAGKKGRKERKEKREKIKPPERFVGPGTKKLWEGKIDGRLVAYFRSKRYGELVDIVVVVQDDLPRAFKRIEYFDNNGDGNLDMMKMRIYDQDRGWRNVGITKDNEYGLAYANSKYNELLKKIKERQKKIENRY